MSKYNKFSSFKIGVVLSYLTIFITIVTGLIYTPWMIKQIGSSDYGIYTLALSIINIFLLDFGLSGAVSRYLSIYRAKGKEKDISNFLGMTFKIYFLIDIVILLVLIVIFFLLELIYVELSAYEISKLKNVFIIVSVFSLITFPSLPFNSILISYEKFTTLKLVELLQKILTVSLVFIALSNGEGLYGLVIINSFSNLFMLIFKVIYIRRKMRININFQYKNNELLVEIIKFSFWVTLISISQRLVINIAPSMLGIFSGTNQISIFAIGIAIEGYIWTFANALNGMFLPRVTKITVEEKSENNITSLMIKVGRFQLIVLSLLIIGFIILGKDFITIWIGVDMIESYYVAVILILPGLVIFTQEIANNYLIAINKIKYRSIDYLITAAISIFCSFMLTPNYGAIGAALSATIGITFGHIIVMNFLYKIKFKLGIKSFFLKCHLSLLPALTLSMVTSLLLNNFIPTQSIIQLVLKALIFTLIHFIYIYFIGLNTSEKNEINKLALSLLRKVFRNEEHN